MSSAKSVLVAGASGLLGSHLRAHLESRGCKVLSLVRRAPTTACEIFWDPQRRVIGEVSPVDALICLCGEDISEGRWTIAKKERIRTSRIAPTQYLADLVRAGNLATPLFLSASGAGYYGASLDNDVSEEAEVGSDFLAQVCKDWEAALFSSRTTDTRCVSLRFGAVLSAQGGALKKMLLPFRLGLGGRLGKGDQWMSWVSLLDAVRAIAFIIESDRASGPINITSPYPVRNLDFTRILGRVIKRPTPFPLPAAILRALFGEIADVALLSSSRVVPTKLLQLGFSFSLPLLHDALVYELRDKSVDERHAT